MYLRSRLALILALPLALLAGCVDASPFVQCTDHEDCGPASVCTDDGLCVGQDPEGDAPGECSDGVDNDQDGALDCDDDGCAIAEDCVGDGTRCSVTVGVDGATYGPYPLTAPEFSRGTFYNQISATSIGLTSSGARWDNFEVRDSSGTVLAADDFSSPSAWALASGGFGDVTISGGYASSTSDWAHTNYVGQSFTVTDSIHFSLDGYWASGTNQIFFGFQSEPGVTSSSDGARGVIYLTVGFSHQRYNTGTGPSALIISYLDDSGASQQELDTNVPIPASGSGWSSLEMGFYACNQD